MSVTKRTNDETASAEAPVENKKPRVEVNLDALKKQVEYYLSDSNLKHDKFFHDKISSNEEGWLDLTNILACNKVKKFNTDAETIVESLKASSELEANEAGDAIRRKSPLPAFEGEVKRAAAGPKDKSNPANRHVQVGDFKFPNLKAAKKRVTEILKSRKVGVLFKEGTPDYNLVQSVMKLHPNASVKLEGMVGMKVDVSPHGESKCFFVVKGENKDQFEDISIVKCFTEFERKLTEEKND
jgi:hypothetical protein